MRPLRPHQVQAIEMLKRSLSHGRKRPLIQAPTGFGKTLLAAAIVEGAMRKGKRLIFTVPALSLVDQTVAAFWAEGIRDVGVLQGAHEMTNPSRPVQVASVQTLARRPIPPADIVVVDECFSAGTTISTPFGGRAIEAIRPGDFVHNAAGVGCVMAVVSQRKQTINVRLSNGRNFNVTNDHPIFTSSGWTPAGKLEVGTRVYNRAEVRRLWGGDAPVGGADRKGSGGSGFHGEAFLHWILRQEARESHGTARGTSEAVGYTEANWSQAPVAGGERSGTHSAADAIAGGARRGLGGGASSDHRRATVLLQDRHRSSGLDGGDRGRWDEPQQPEGESGGSDQDGLPARVWVVGVSRNQRRGDEVVFNLRVSGHPSYFAGGILVHNCHRWFDFYGRWMADEAWAGVPFVGLSATPWTKGLGRWYDDLIVAATTEQLIEAGYLSRFEVFAPSHPDLTGVRTVAGDYHEGDLSAAMDKPALTADVVETWRRLGEDRPTLVFAVDRAHARHLQERFAEAGIATGYVDAFTELDEREAIRKKFHTGEMRVVVNVGCLTTGVDWDVRCIVLARPTKSEMLFVQIIGRGLRTAEGKANCRIIDHSDTHLRLGFVTDVHREKLDDGQPKAKTASERKQPLPKECPSCSYLKPAKVHACPACGFAPATQSSVETADGDIARVDGKMMAASRAARQKWYSEVLWICRERGYKPGWAANQYREKFGVWPRGLDDVPSHPSPEVASWVKSRMIRYAKGRAKGAHRSEAVA